MDQPGRIGAQHSAGRSFPGVRGLAWLGGTVAAACAAVVAALLAVVFAATVAVIGLIGGVLLALGTLVWRARRTVARPAQAPAGDPAIIEARHVGGHSWVAYGWDQQGR